MIPKKVIKLFLGIFFAIFFSFILLKNIDFNYFLQLFKKIDLITISFAIFFVFLDYFFRVQRWKFMLMSDNQKITWNDCCGPFMASYAVNNVLPFRAGDIMRALAFNKALNVKLSTTIVSLILERLLDLFVILFLFLIIILFFNLSATNFLNPELWPLIIIIFILSCVFLFPNFMKPIILKICFYVSKISRSLSQKLESFTVKIFDSLLLISNFKIMLRLFFWTFMIWFCEGLVFWFVALSIPDISNNLSSWAALPVGTLATLIPSTPGYIGTFDYFTSETMKFFGNSAESSLVFALVVHIILWFITTAIGAIFMFRIYSEKI